MFPPYIETSGRKGEKTTKSEKERRMETHMRTHLLRGIDYIPKIIAEEYKDYITDNGEGEDHYERFTAELQLEKRKSVYEKIIKYYQDKMITEKTEWSDIFDNSRALKYLYSYWEHEETNPLGRNQTPISSLRKYLKTQEGRTHLKKLEE